MKGSDKARISSDTSIIQQVIRACDTCRKKKIRCEPTGETCVQCIKYKTDCHFTPISTKRKPRRPAGHKHVAELEERLRKMESMLQVAMQGEKSKSIEFPEVSAAFGISRPFENENATRALRADTRLADNVWRRHLSTYDSSISSLRGSPSFGGILGYSKEPGLIYSPTAVSERHSTLWKGDLVRNVFTRRSFRELPSKSTALVLIEESFRSGNSAFPIFDQQSFMSYVHENYTESGPNDPGWWACINVVLSLAHRFRAMRTLEVTTENKEACGYIQNALAVVSELTMLHNSLPAVQALVGMAIVLEGTPNPRLCSVLVGAAVRLAQTMGLHRRNQDSSLSEVEVEQRKKVFWIAYFLDKDISLRTGQPPAQDDDDMDVELPSETLLQLGLGCDSGLDPLNFFNCRTRLAIIQGGVYKRLYSAKAVHQSDAEKMLAVYELDAMLAAWRESVPIDFDEETLTTLQPPICPDVLHRIILRFNYVNCLIIIHRPFTLNDELSVSSDEICVTEARKAVRLIQITPQGDYACAWLLLHFFFAAVTTILHSVFHNPSQLSARTDLQLVEPFLGLLELLARERKSEDVQRMYDYCKDLIANATEAVEHVSARLLLSQDGSSNGRKESVEDFIRRVECVSQGCTEIDFEPPGSLELDIGSWGGFGNGLDDFEMLN